jgi:translocation and assembly module TamB
MDFIGGFLPFNANITGGRIYSPADTLNPVLSFAKADATINWWELLRQNLVISSFNLTSPALLLHQDKDGLGIINAFKPLTEREEPPESRNPVFFNRFSIFAPSVGVDDGRMIIDESVNLPKQLELPVPLIVENLSFTVFLELSEKLFFFDLPDFVAEIPGSPYDFLQLSGQFYSDGEYFELNRFRASTQNGYADFTFEATPVNIFEENIEQQFLDATFKLDITESSFKPELLRQFISGYPVFNDDLEIELFSEGTFSEFFIDKLQANIGSSSILISADARNLLNDQISYTARLENVVIHPDMLNWVSETYYDSTLNFNRYQLSTIRGELAGSSSELETEFYAETQAGFFRLNGNLGFEDILAYNLSFEVDSLDITPFLADTLNNSIIFGKVTLDGRGLAGNAEFNSNVDLSNSRLLGHQADIFTADFTYNSNQLLYNLRGASHRLLVSARGRYGQFSDRQTFVTEGFVQNFDLKNFYSGFYADSSNFNSTFSANVEWSTIDDLTGRFSFEMDESTINADTLRPHQFYSDINIIDDKTRRIRFTSSFFDGEISGNLQYSLIRDFAKHWSFYLRERIAEEFIFNNEFTYGESPFSQTEYWDEPLAADLQIEMTVKDLSLLRKYLPQLPNLESTARFNTTVNATKERLLITGSLADQFSRYGDYSAENFNAAFTGSFRYGSELKTSNTVDLQLSSTRTKINETELKESFLSISMRDDSLSIRNHFERYKDDLKLESQLTGFLLPGRFTVFVNQLTIGSPTYNWITEGVPRLTYTDRKVLEIEDFILTSDDNFIEINGFYSTNANDSVEYTVQNLDLSRISTLIGGRIQFSGIMNGNFVTQTLTQIPTVAGDIHIDEARILDRIIGDVSLNSQFNSETNRFDTEIHVFTNPEKYPQYYQRNNGIGQDLRLTGYFQLPDETTGPDDDLFYFDADLRQIDMWIITFIIPNIITESEGRSTGTGFVRATREGLDFNATFMIDDVLARPAFTNVNYRLNGELDFNMNDGILFRNIRVNDSYNGSGLLYGQIDLNQFSASPVLDMTLDLNNLHFMNNSYDPDIPFYGSIFGTGQAQFTGPSFSPLLRTTRPLVISSNSEISIPLEPETEFEQDRRFIQFVDSFDIPFWERQFTPGGRSTDDQENAPERTFLELFTMDLQFLANDPLNVRLIFDPVTNDILSANGIGQVRILLEDQDVSMFGRFNITGGEYQFVSGDVFTRRFTLQEGGNISWSGDLIDAALNVTAVYRARPNISTLLSGTGTGSGVDPGQRIPVELVLQIGGTITSVENDFFFRIPTGIEGTADPTITTQINNLNQNEDEKLIQATSILLSGNFIPSSQAQGLGIAEGFSGTASLVNPLITSQVINPLLSNQINSLLRSDITFDIDFNLTAFNEVDLGVALRLFDDRVILRREGQITGEQSDIGDLGATYRINRTFSLTAFHRQDPTLTYTSGVETRQAQEMNGIGLEAQVQFNSWQNLGARISNAFRSLLGIKEDEQEEILSATNVLQNEDN